ncbi:hypothetical protein PTSG_12284 [Salpingoeca rosetta]|uniref:Calmodulin-lysine N-methyltransferase n=1 Tax=Salpingoeca rosetta (strain ATCC 50818 / BSB-021) TaxID=946362 RepID=F2U9X9_SALR5|nr:uncharacterized protein PTSG_12284 [Salpingoeca rosetta]EGD73554.1 hypothetical protein PTSG_12284 [Salpingoeca rosetta]|eukprot:XP_004993836.1 hypothetical protein PTSG_12284 [Salpingoeca rosetta]
MSSTHKHKWRILRDAILKAAQAAKQQQEQPQEQREPQEEEGAAVDDASVRRFQSYGLVTSHRVEPGTINRIAFSGNGTVLADSADQDSDVLLGTWHRHDAPGFDSFQPLVFHLRPVVTLQDMLGFNNTGNVCIWPSEEVLVHWILSQPGVFKGLRVCEIGGGMASLAGLAVAINEQAEEVVLTDGNENSMSCIHATLAANRGAFTTENVTAQRLDWTQPAHYQHLQHRFDVVLCADCCFFDEFRPALAEVLQTITRPSGHVLLICPERRGTRSAFLQLASDRFRVEEIPSFDAELQRQHEHVLASNPKYEPDIHFPKAAKLTPLK